MDLAKISLLKIKMKFTHLKALLMISKGLLNFIIVLQFNLDKQTASRLIFLVELYNHS